MREAILNLEKLIIRTPLIPFNNLDVKIQSRIFLKPENLQIFGSYKIRGVTAVLKDIESENLCKGLCAASAGNMAQAIAFSAQQLNIPSRIFVPESAPHAKLLAIQKLGAEIIKMPYEDVWKIVRGDLKLSDDMNFIHPAFNQFLLNGYGKIADEIIDEMPDVDAIVIPFGVGGLSLGIAKRIQQRHSHIAIFTCQPETAAPFKKSLELEKPSSIQRTPSFVDAIGTPEILPQVFHQLVALIKDSLVVSLNDAKQALKNLYFNHKLVCEGAAGCSLAAASQLARLGNYNKIVCILSGGNIDTDVLNQILLC